jgi:hypothetical protein
MQRRWQPLPRYAHRRNGRQELGKGGRAEGTYGRSSASVLRRQPPSCHYILLEVCRCRSERSTSCRPDKVIEAGHVGGGDGGRSPAGGAPDAAAGGGGGPMGHEASCAAPPGAPRTTTRRPASSAASAALPSPADRVGSTPPTQQQQPGRPQRSHGQSSLAATAAQFPQQAGPDCLISDQSAVGRRPQPSSDENGPTPCSCAAVGAASCPPHPALLAGRLIS